jgi:hypothetical protein
MTTHPTLSRFTHRWLIRLALALAASAPCCFGQAGLQDMFFAAGTSARDPANRNWAYLVWDSTTPAFLLGRQYAIYQKPGAAAADTLYQRVALVQRQTDARVIAALTNRAVNLGENLAELDDGLTKLFQSMTNALSLPLPEKISAIIRGATGNPTLEANLRLLAKSHPALAMSLGVAHAELIPGADGTEFTFEIREFDPAIGRDVGVVGRITVTAGQPAVLPAPDAPVLVPENNPKGHLNAKFRWATSAELRRLSLLGHGFNLWRMTRSFAEAGGYPFNPPPPGMFPILAEQHADDVRRVNRPPVLPGKRFDAATVADFAADPATVFVTDDNGRFDGRPPFQDGETFYYFVTARDLLGHDGFASPGTRVTLCNRLPPSPPKELRVENDYTYTNRAGQQVLKVFWTPKVNTPEDRATAYYVYRWTSQTQMLHFDALGDYLTNRIAGPIPHLDGVTELCVLDNGPGAPTMPANADETYWYSVRAAETNACGTNFSPSSRMVFGVLRDRVGPAAPTGSIELNCPSPTLAFTDSTGVGESGQNPHRAYFRVEASRIHSFLQWAEFTARVTWQRVISQNPLVIGPVEETNELGRVEFDGAGVAAINFDLPRTGLISVIFEARSVLANGLVSSTVVTSPRSPRPPDSRLLMWFEAGVTFATTAVSSPRPVRITRVNLSPDTTNYWVTLVIDPRVFARCRVQATPDLKNWTTIVVTNVFPGMGSVTFRDLARAGAPYRFYRLIPDDAPPPCVNLMTTDPVTGTVKGVKQVVNLTPASKEYRIYRRVDEGPLTLIAQGRGDYDERAAVTNLDQALPAGAVTMCYYAQLLDRHGNPSPMTQIGGCFTSIQSPPPCPVVSAVERAGTRENRKAIVRWFCPPSGVDHFRVLLTSVDTAPPGAVSGGSTSGGTGRAFLGQRQVAGEVLRTIFTSAEVTDPVGSPRLGNGPQFTWTLTDLDEREYTVTVVAVSKAGDRSDQDVTCREGRRFRWTGPPLTNVPPQVPWPARGLPALAKATNWPGVQARLMGHTNGLPGYDASYPVGIQIGRIDYAVSNVICSPPRSPLDVGDSPADVPIAQSLTRTSACVPTQGTNMILLPILDNPTNYLFLQSATSPADPLLPVVLYRTQVANEEFPTVSEDVVQVSPMIEKIAYAMEHPGSADPGRVVLRDPFVRANQSSFRRSEVLVFPGPNCPPGMPFEARTIEASSFDLYLLDTQPVLAGAAYQYFLVRFDPVTKEPVQVIPAGQACIPAN